MSKKQILTLFICSLVPWTVGNGLVPLLPVYASHLGADSSTAGYYLAFSYFAIAAGAISGGWVSERFHNRKIPLIIAGSVGIPTMWLLGRVENIWGLSILTALLWFCGGLGLALIGILTGLFAGQMERGKIFGIISLSSGLGALIGGMATGYMVDRWGFPFMFSAMAVFLVLWPLAGLFLKDKEEPHSKIEDHLSHPRVILGKNYNLLFTASLIASITSFMIVLLRSLLMNGLEFSALEISSMGAISGIIAMPLPLLMGWLSDRAGRKIFMYIGYIAGIFSAVILAVAASLWQFFAVSIIQAIFIGVTGTVGNAFVADLVPKEGLGRGLSLYAATGWIGGVLGFAFAGTTLQKFGTLPTIMIGICFPIIAIGLIQLIPTKIKRKAIAADQSV